MTAPGRHRPEALPQGIPATVLVAANVGRLVDHLRIPGRYQR
jgi:hypothetical protein